MADSYETQPKKPKSKKVVSRTLCIVLVIVALIGGGAAGYWYGKDQATSDAEAALQQKVDTLEDDLDKAKTAVGSEAQENQEDAAQNQQTLDALESENATLKQTVADQKEEIADLEQQLEDAQAENQTE